MTALVRVAQSLPSKYLRHLLASTSSSTSSTSSSLHEPGTTMLKHTNARRIEGLDKNVWVEFVQLAQQNPSAVNLGQGFPDFAAPETVTQALADCALSAEPLAQQYTRSFGHPALVRSLARLYSRYHGRELNPDSNILVSVGGYGALFCCMQALVQEGDEVIIIEPFFDCYEPMVRMAGGTAVFVALRPQGDGSSSADWTLDLEEFESKFNSKTKALILNTPNNPLGKVYTRAELEAIASACVRHDALCISDEVYEWLIYSGHTHTRIATLPGMWERTLSVGSAGKTFSVTGWKLGWTVGPAHLLKHLQTVHQHCIYTCPTPTQEAVSRALDVELQRLDAPSCYLRSLALSLESKRDRVARFLRRSRLRPTVPDGGYFMVADVSALVPSMDLSQETDAQLDYRVVKWMVKNKNLALIPMSAFYSEASKPEFQRFLRFCFIKEDSTLDAAEKILNEWADEV